MTSTDDRAEDALANEKDSSPSDREAASPLAGRTVRKVATALAPFLTAVLATVWVFRPTFTTGRLPGEIGDARWTIAVHEHWFAVWQGRESVRDMNYYFPVRGTLGTSDAFLLQGQVYSLARALGLGFVDSWLLAQIAFFLLGAIGLAVLSKQVLASNWSRVALVAMTCASYPVLVTLYHVQMVGFLSASWLFVGGHALLTRSHIRTGLALVVITPPLLALSSWYSLVLIAIVLAFLTLFVGLFSRGRRILAQIKTTSSDAFGVLRSPVGALLVVALIVAWGAVLWIYLPSLGLLRPPKWSEVVNYSPRISDVFNASLNGGGLWAPLYEPWRTGAHFSDERALGFTPVVLAAFLLIGVLHIRSMVLGPPSRADGRLAGPAGLLAVWFTVISSVALVVMDDRGLNLYRLLWFHVPGIESIRAPFRIQVFLYALALFFVIRSCELRLQRPPERRPALWVKSVLATGVALLLLLITIEMQRPIRSEWTASQLLPQALESKIEQAQRLCDAVIVVDENPKDSPFITPIDGVIFSAMSGLPTPQGYSRADPTGHPGPNADPSRLATWMRSQGAGGRVCSISSSGMEVIP